MEEVLFSTKIQKQANKHGGKRKEGGDCLMGTGFLFGMLECSGIR